MEMLEKEDAKTFKKLGINFAGIIVVALALVLASMYFA